MHIFPRSPASPRHTLCILSTRECQRARERAQAAKFIHLSPFLLRVESEQGERLHCPASSLRL